MNLDDYKVVLYRNQPAGWVAEIPAIPGCYALMEMREEAVSELARVFEMIAAECSAPGLSLPFEGAEIVHT
jgi:predicted RNase H-like HicB family nuclease